MGTPRHDFRLIRFLAQHALSGVMAAAVFVYLIVKLDLFGLGTLVASGQHGWTALLLLFAGLAATFASLAMGTAVFLLPKDEERWR
ncbi:MAG: hypothetical protein ACLFU0_04855 [Alphaproteobacteria bacterium]